MPIADPNIVDEFILDFKKNNYDYLSNANPWTYPDGFDVEVFHLNCYQKLLKKPIKIILKMAVY